MNLSLPTAFCPHRLVLTEARPFDPAGSRRTPNRATLLAISAFFLLFCGHAWAKLIPTGVVQDKAHSTEKTSDYATLPIGFQWRLLDKHHAEIYFEEPRTYQDLNYLVNTANNFANINILLTSYASGVAAAVNRWAIKNQPTLFTVKCGDTSCTGQVSHKKACVDKTCTLPDKFGNLTLTGSSALNGVGNLNPNVIRGNTAANRLNGGAGDDKLKGGQGKDTLVDLEGNNKLDGGDGNDNLTAGDGNDTLNGGTGKDTLTGGGGVDAFRFSSALDASTNVDTITDFTPGSDQIFLKTSIFSIPHKYMGKSLGTITDAAQFESGPGQKQATTPQTRLIYDTTGGNLYYDADGSKNAASPVKFAVLRNLPLLSVTDFALF
jgi:Ca2+-binding RTX toxin-like protein